ncbi:hypothetical protein HOLleu_28340 [Holothuria leucospilota]|uniref:Uncharacterized protein n=1 Tax=Holothuria leucospilota TaxID=206669 RepID=A0A9Q1BM47_HOLLE|nr:hypothetical protein HOLleu_28340 [Holothuria leucospilota]
MISIDNTHLITCIISVTIYIMYTFIIRNVTIFSFIISFHHINMTYSFIFTLVRCQNDVVCVTDLSLNDIRSLKASLKWLTRNRICWRERTRLRSTVTCCATTIAIFLIWPTKLTLVLSLTHFTKLMDECILISQICHFLQFVSLIFLKIRWESRRLPLDEKPILL